jgi:hypothetical protein
LIKPWLTLLQFTIIWNLFTEIFMISIIISQALLFSTSASKSSKVVNLCQTSTWYFSLLTTRLASWDWISQFKITQIFVYSLQIFSNFCHQQIVVSITICCPIWSNIKYVGMPSPNIRMLSIWLWIFPYGDVQVYLWINNFLG